MFGAFALEIVMPVPKSHPMKVVLPPPGVIVMLRGTAGCALNDVTVVISEALVACAVFSSVADRL